MSDVSLKTRKDGRGLHPNSRKALESTQWKPGICPNPGGRPKRDIAAEIARAVFEKHPEAIEVGMAKAIKKGNAYVFKELAERGYGKLIEFKEITHKYEEMSDGDIDARIAKLERDLGLAAQIDEIGEAGVTRGNEASALAAQDTDILPGPGTVKA